MRPDSRSVSFTFHRDVLSVKNSPEITKNSKNLRRRLQDRFEKDKPSSTCKEQTPKEKQTSNDRSKLEQFVAWKYVSRLQTCSAVRSRKIIQNHIFGTHNIWNHFAGEYLVKVCEKCNNNFKLISMFSLIRRLEIQEFYA